MWSKEKGINLPNKPPTMLPIPKPKPLTSSE